MGLILGGYNGVLLDLSLVSRALGSFDSDVLRYMMHLCNDV